MYLLEVALLLQIHPPVFVSEVQLCLKEAKFNFRILV